MSSLINFGLCVLVCSLSVFVINLLFNRILRLNNNINLKFLRSLATVLTVTVFTYTYLSQFEVTKNLSDILLKSGSLIIAIATFASQRVLANVISGIAITTSKPFDTGDKIKVLSAGGVVLSEGIVTDINLRHTIIKRYDGQCDIVPNSLMDSLVLTNTTLIDNIGNHIEIGVSFDSDLDEACDILKRIVVDNELTLNTDEDTDVYIRDLISSGSILTVLVVSRSLDDSFKCCSDIRRNIANEFKVHNIKLSD